LCLDVELIKFAEIERKQAVTAAAD
jgi:hypothetical protein